MKGTKLYIADIGCLRDAGRYGALYARLPEYRKTITDRYRRPDDRMRSVGAGTLLMRALEENGHPELVYADGVRGENGKPFFPCAPDVHFNLSHSGKYVMCALSDREIGCDIEQILPDRSDVAARFFTDEERLFIGAGGDKKESTERFYRIWTLKESYMKATGLGFCKELGSFSVVPGDGGIVFRDAAADSSFTFREYDRIAGYAVSVCKKGRDAVLPEELSDIGL